MAKRKQKKKPRKSESVRVAKKPKTQAFPARSIQWSFAIFDRHSWGGNAERDAFLQVAHRLRESEQRTWAGIEQSQRRDHSVSVAELSKAARDRLMKIRHDDADVLWRLRFSGTKRLWGIRVNDVFRVLWWDPDHQVCPSTKRNT